MVDGDKEDLVNCYDALSIPAVPATAALGLPPSVLGPGRGYETLPGRISGYGVEWVEVFRLYICLGGRMV